MLKQKAMDKEAMDKFREFKVKKREEKYQESFKIHFPQPSEQFKGPLKRSKEPCLIKCGLLL
jgi:hypothetical protein